MRRLPPLSRTRAFQTRPTALLAVPAGALALLLAFAACGSFDYGAEDPTEVDIADPEKPNWEADIRPIMAYKCMNCHASPRPRHAPKGTPHIEFANESEFKKPNILQSVFRRAYVTTDDPMPPEFGTPLTTTEKLALKNYLKANGVDTTVAVKPTAKPDSGAGGGTTGLGLSTNYRDKCSSCHESEGQGKIGPKIAGTSLSEAAFTSTVRNGKGGGSMPAFAAAAYSDADLKADYVKLKAAK